MSTLLKKVRRQDNLEKAWRVIQENARASTSKQVKLEVDEFAQAPGLKIRSLSRRLATNKFEFKPATGIPSPKRDSAGRKTGKIRPIVLAPLESRIVQRALLEVLLQVPAVEQKASTPFSFGGVRKGKTSSREEASLSGVAGAIDCVREAISAGATHYVCADIKSFFTRISKRDVSEVIAKAVGDPEFMLFFERAIATELENMAELREHASAFPIEDIGVAQGNSLSTLLGNITLATFDLEMNKGENRCIRYIDDFIIMERTAKAANAQLRKAIRLLHQKGMELAQEKSSSTARPIDRKFSFLGIEISPGYFRPCPAKQRCLLLSIENEFSLSEAAFRGMLRNKTLPRNRTLISTLKRVDGTIDAWGKAYFFCNDEEFFRQTDQKIRDRTKRFLREYNNIRQELDEHKRDRLLGVSRLSEQKRSPFKYPVTGRKALTPAASP